MPTFVITVQRPRIYNIYYVSQSNLSLVIGMQGFFMQKQINTVKVVKIKTPVTDNLNDDLSILCKTRN